MSSALGLPLWNAQLRCLRDNQLHVSDLHTKHFESMGVRVFRATHLRHDQYLHLMPVIFAHLY